jgi:hypothetical protein
MPQTLEVKAQGLWTNPNRLNLPPGALLQAENCVLTRPGVTSRRRGFRRSAALNNPASALSEYLGILIALDGSTLKRMAVDGDSWASFPGSFSPPANTRMRFLESNGNLYLLTSLGPFMVDSLTGTPRRAGIPEGLDMGLTKTGTGGSWFLPNTLVGYRHTLKRKDANDNDKQGAPSSQERIANSYAILTAWTRAGTVATFTLVAHGFSVADTIEIANSSDTTAVPNGSYTVQTTPTADSFTITVPNAGGAAGTASVGKAFNVSVEITIHDDALAGDVLELWRTDLSASDDDSPGDDHRLILSRALTAADITTGIVTLLDNQDSVFLKDNLYTNQGLEGLLQANARPPLARFIVQHEDHTLLFDTKQPQEIDLELLTITGLVDDTSTITFTVGGTPFTFTFSAAENQGALKFKRFTTGLFSKNIEDTVKSLRKIMNRSTVPLWAEYISTEDDAPGRIRIYARALGLAPFSVTVNSSGTGAVFSPLLPTSGTSVSSSDNAKPNGANRSKAGQPEAVPTLNTHIFGKRQKAILAVAALKEAVLVWKEDGIFILTGQSDGSGGFSFVVDELDPTVILSAPDTLALFDNSAVGHATQGVVKAGQGAPSVISSPQIETDLRRISKLPGFADVAHAIGYESDREYILFVPEKTTDEHPTIAYVYGNGGWSTWRKPVAAAHVLTSSDVLHLAHAVDPYVLIERKTFSPTGADFVDEDIPVTITATGTTVNDEGDTVSAITLTYMYDGADLDFGWLLEQGSSRDIIDQVTALGGGSFTVRLRNLVTGFAPGAATVGMPITMIVEWAPVTAGNPAALKQYSAAAVQPERAGGTYLLGFQASTQAAVAYIDEIRVRKSLGWGLFPWGGAPWGSSRQGATPAIRTWIPRDHQLCTALGVILKARVVRHAVDILFLALDVRAISTRTERRPRQEGVIAQ